MLAHSFIRCFATLLFTVYFSGIVSAKSDIPEARKISNEPVRIGHYDIYYSTFNSSFLQPEIAAAYKLERNPRIAILNIAIRDVQKSELGKTVTGRLSGETSNLLSQKTGLSFHEVKEGDAIYYLADFKFTHSETLKFTINVQPGQSSSSERVEFRKTFFDG